MALLIFFARAARTGIVTPYLLLTSHDLLHRLHIASPSHLRLFQFATLAAHEGFFKVIRGSRNQPRWMMPIAATALRRGACFQTARSSCLRANIRRPLDNLHEVQVPRRVFLEALQHRFEHVERFFLVLDQRIMLAITAQANSLLDRKSVV